jgi:hypothetical protein
MKSKNLFLAAMLMVYPSAMMAQQNVKKAFDALLKDNIVEIKTHHSLERDPETGRKESQADVYDLMITDPSVLHHIKDIQKAFEKDNEAAYQLRTVSHAGSGPDYTSLAVGDGRPQPVAIGRMKGSDYIYACFLDKDDPEKKYRYAYAMEWVEKEKRINVRLAITYATTQQYRQSHHRMKRITINGQNLNFDSNSFPFGNSFPFDSSSVFISDSLSFNFSKTTESWLSEFNTFKNLFLKNPNSTASNYYASYIYKLCKKADELDELEKKMVIRELEKLMKSTDDELMQQMFDTSINRLKK